MSVHLTAPIRYALTPRAAAGGEVDLVLDLYRGSVPVHSRTLARVAPPQVAPLMRTCRRHLERRGAQAVSDAAPAPRGARAPAPWMAAPVAAFDWMFAG